MTTPSGLTIGTKKSTADELEALYKNVHQKFHFVVHTNFENEIVPENSGFQAFSKQKFNQTCQK